MRKLLIALLMILALSASVVSAQIPNVDQAFQFAAQLMEASEFCLHGLDPLLDPSRLLFHLTAQNDGLTTQSKQIIYQLGFDRGFVC